MSENRMPLRYVSSGKLTNQENFKHSSRNLDTFVILLGIQGVLYIAQGEQRYELHENQFMLLRPGYQHYGWKASDQTVSYYWCHFAVDHSYRYLSQEEMTQYAFLMQNGDGYSAPADVFILPEIGTLHYSDRECLLFRQLLDLSVQQCYSHYLIDYVLSALIMEFSQEHLQTYFPTDDCSVTKCNLAEITEWIRINFTKPLSVQEIATVFNYNANYLSTIFKKQTGFSLLKYIHFTKIAAAKQFLLNSTQSIKEIAHQTGFNDEKTFMKIFKQYEDVTPTQYRNAFYRTRLNKE